MGSMSFPSGHENELVNAEKFDIHHSSSTTEVSVKRTGDVDVPNSAHCQDDMSDLMIKYHQRWMTGIGGLV